jgi:hypothetical protein
MKLHPLRVAFAGLALISSVVIAITAIVCSQVSQDPMYSVAQVQTGLMDQPQAWVGRAVRVRGMAEPCPLREGTAILWQCADDPLILVPAAADRVTAPLPLSRVTLDGISAILHGLPLLQDIVTTPRAVPQFTPARFVVRLRSQPAQACGDRAPCYEAVLLAVST